MKLTCPECGATITADQINIHDQVAVCGVCNTVFRFNLPERKHKQRKVKLRKVKQPPRLTVIDPPGELVMQYRRIFNEEERGWALGNGFFALIVLPLLLILTLIFAPVWVLGLIAVWMTISWYVQAALWINRTTIRLDDAQLAITQKPLPSFFSARSFELDPAEIVEVFCDETEESRQSAGVSRFFHVRARLINGDAIMLLKALPGDVAFFIAQELNAGPDADSFDELADQVPDDYSDTYIGDVPDADTLAFRESVQAAHHHESSLADRG